MTMTTMPNFLDHRPTSTADAAVASLEQLGVAGHRVQFVPVGPLESFKGEIVGQVPVPGTPLDDTQEVTLYISRSGIAERLPIDFLEPLPTIKDEAKHVIESDHSEEYWHRQMKAAGSGRQFITVIDRAINRLRRDIGRLSWSLSSLSRDPVFARHTLDLMHLADLPLTDEEQVLLAALLQRLPEWVGPTGGMVTVLEQFLNVPVTVHEKPGPRLEIPAHERRPLGSARCRLGESLALGPAFNDTRLSLQVAIGPLSLAEYVALDRDRKWRTKVEALLKMISPAACRTDIELVLQPSDRAARLADPLRGILGRTTYLGS